MSSKTSPFPDFGLSPDGIRAAVLDHYYEWPGMDGAKGEIWCYSDALSYSGGDEVVLFVSSTAAYFDIEVTRDGARQDKVFSMWGVASQWQETPRHCSVEGCGWAETVRLRVDPAWASGAYRLSLTAAGNDGSPMVCHHLIIVRPGHLDKVGRVLQIAATNTWLAYNTWGGSNHYQGITGPQQDQCSPVVSTQRPWARGFVELPASAPRVPLGMSIPPATVPRYPHMEWAYATGHSKKYASAGWASYDSHFFRWAEGAGYACDLISQHDLHFRPEILDGYDCVVCVGHDEYWTWEMRDAVDAFVSQGGNAARFAGNFMWQTRFEDEGLRQVCYKYRSREEDPAYRGHGDIRRATNSWEAPEIGRPGASTFGLNSTRGVYAGWGGCAPRGPKGFPVYRPEHWAFAGTGVYYGDLLGADGHVFGYEVDGLDYEIRNGLPFPTSNSGAPEGLEILALGLASQVEESSDIALEDQFLRDDDGRYTAKTLFGDDSDEHLEKVKRGSGMIVNFKMGAGEVFHAGSCEWVAGLLRSDPMVERVTANVLNKFLR